MRGLLGMLFRWYFWSGFFWVASGKGKICQERGGEGQRGRRGSGSVDDLRELTGRETLGGTMPDLSIGPSPP